MGGTLGRPDQDHQEVIRADQGALICGQRGLGVCPGGQRGAQCQARPEDRKRAEQARLGAIRADSAEVAIALDLADEFAELVRKRSNGTLTDWLAKGEAASCPELRRFA